MSADWAQVTLWRSAPLDEHATSLLATEDTLVQLGEDVFGQALGNWTGATALLAGMQRNLLKESLEDRITEVSAVRRALQAASDSVAGVESAVRSAQDYATDNGLWIAGDGTVNDEKGLSLTSFTSDDDAEAALADRQAVVDECAARVEEAVRRAHYVDADLFALLNGEVLSGNLARRDASDFKDAERDGAEAGRLDPYGPPQDSATPAQNAAWWNGLTEKEQNVIRDDHPEWIANRDGLSAKLRNEANAVLLKRYTKYYTDELDRLGAEFDADPTVETSQKYVWIRDEVLPALNKLNEITAPKIDDMGRTVATDRQLLGLTIVPGERVQAVVAVGDVDTADKVAVFTPGFTTTVAKLGNYVNKMTDLKVRAEDMGSLNNGVGKSPTVATVTWLDYQAPQWSTVASNNSVLSARTAVAAGSDLADFYQGINASRSDDPHLVGLGHSYGSAVTGAALTKESGVDAAVVFGSPGLPINTVDELKLHGTLYNEQADGDRLVGNSGATGFDPDRIPGTVQLATGASTSLKGEPLSASHGHSEYLDDRTTSQNNLAAVIMEMRDELVARE
ncbi:alpha/beta hydrolase [Kineosporia sp. NBRC 101731]|uniref:alpha/beta hydrolase n=1 Tax=Kineosporia sp. NBRC 101731 TaxID=3032199 RepID=UPI0024A535BF|nr:alpha/beta hydrolase [Kineosporia sp. NBRC 101731]GLY27983.1 hypothetical protein Kisp02_13480 [Kineosporia sp. NBRC 101731]